MSFFQNFKAKRAAKKAKKLYEKELAEYNYENDLLSRALEKEKSKKKIFPCPFIFTIFLFSSNFIF